jgi:hypothetical protein
MPSAYTKSLEILNAELFKSSVGGTSEPYVYFTFGKVRPWTNELSPPTPTSNVIQQIDVWNNVIGAKQIQGNDVSLCVPRINWTSGNVYTQYDDQRNTTDYGNTASPFYVLTTDYNVYKCLSNNNGEPSTVKPESTILNSAVEGADKYVWKYLYTLTDDEKLKFLTTNYMPVKKLTEDNGSLQWSVQQNAIEGAIEAIKIEDGGSGYSAVSPPTIVISGDGKDATAVATVNSTTTAISSISIQQKGYGYTNATISLVSSEGSGGILRPLIAPAGNPSGGHGFNPVEELGASNVIINLRLNGTESGIFDIQNNFRQIALIKNPRLTSSQTYATGIVYSQLTTLILDTTGSSNFSLDEIAFQGATLETATFKGTVVSWNSDNGQLKLNDVTGNPKSEIITGSSSRTVRAVVGVDTSTKLQKYSGSILYIDNSVSIQRSADQTEEFKIILSF